MVSSRGGPPRRRGRRTGAKPAPPLPSAAATLAKDAWLEQWRYEADTTPVGFDTFGLDQRLMQGLRDLGYAETRPVQSAVIGLARDGHDVIACAETGTGKTLAFVLPILARLLPQFDGPREAGTRALVLAPTRELAVQIEDSIQGMLYHTPISSIAVYGGSPMEPQERALRAGADLVVATPGRLMDHMRSDIPRFEHLEVVVLDEADRMMDMGFWPDVQRILATLPPKRQTLLFSATMPGPILEIARGLMNDPKYVQVGRRGGPARTITHSAIEVPAGRKVDRLVTFLRQEATGPVLIFCRTKIGADRLARQLAQSRVKVTALHADRSQEQRTAAVEGFRNGRFDVLVATDIAARGIDIDGIAHVVNFDVPDTTEAYVHRVGRTGRAETAGHALTLLTPDQRRHLSALENALGVRFEESQLHVAAATGE